MRITPLEIRSQSLKKGFIGYDVREVEAFKELAASALEEAAMEIMRLEERLHETEKRLTDHMENEKTLKDAITTAQKMVDDIKENARKEAELTVAEAKFHGDGIVRQAQSRATELKEEISRLKKQRVEIETSIKAILDYHSSKLLIEEDESKKADEEADKLKFLPK